MIELMNGDCLIALRELADNSVDSIVTDPPYGISFMAKKWDYDVPSVDVWKECLRVLKPGGYALIACGTRTQHRMVVNIEDAGFEIRDVVTWLYGSGFPKSLNIGKAAARPDLEGFGTALKPACEFWTLARKPLSESTVAKNALKYGTGGLNIDACRIGEGAREETRTTEGRFPANLILDEEAAAALDEQSGILKTGGDPRKTHQASTGLYGMGNKIPAGPGFGGDSGGASRFFYVAKASKKDRGDGNAHPTVKPTKLMEYLITLVTPPGGIVCDPFMGSGSTGVAAVSLDFQFIGIELSDEYFEISAGRLRAAKATRVSA